MTAMAAFSGVRPTAKAFGRSSYSGQRGYVLAIEQAKTAATRERRVAKAVAELSELSGQAEQAG